MEENNVPSTSPPSGKNSIGWVIAIIILLAVVGFFVFGRSNTNEGNGQNEPSGQTMSPQPTPSPSPIPPAATPSIKQFTVTGSNFKFDPAELRVKVGDTVKVTFVNSGGFHDWALDGYNVKTKQFQSPGQETVEFVANQAGTFEYYCSVGTHRAMGMKGKLIVEQ